MKSFFTLLFLSLSFSTQANKLGNIMVLMYHKIGYPETTWCRTPEKFQEDLELLYKKNYYLINLVDLVQGTAKVPKGKAPIVLTFDDLAPGQVALKNGVWDPQSAVGMIEAMYAKHPDFGRAGSFYINPKKDTDVKEMLKEMVRLGYEIGNHTYSHPKLKTLSQEQVAKEIVMLQNWVQSFIPGYTMKTMALPHGVYPKVDQWAVQGEYAGVQYKYIALLKVGAEPSVSPFSLKFNPYRITRVRGSEMLDHPEEKNSLAYIRSAIAYFDKYPEKKFTIE